MAVECIPPEIADLYRLGKYSELSQKPGQAACRCRFSMVGDLLTILNRLPCRWEGCNAIVTEKGGMIFSEDGLTIWWQ